jgi:hypothetical protein
MVNGGADRAWAGSEAFVIPSGVLVLFAGYCPSLGNQACRGNITLLAVKIGAAPIANPRLIYDGSPGLKAAAHFVAWQSILEIENDV